MMWMALLRTDYPTNFIYRSPFDVWSLSIALIQAPIRCRQ